VSTIEIGLTRDVRGMCVVTINGREAIRDNGDVISHFATLDWFSAQQHDKCMEGDCHYYGQKRPTTCACSKEQGQP